MKTKHTVTKTTKELSYIPVPDGPAHPQKGQLVVWKTIHVAQTNAVENGRSCKPADPVETINYGLGWEKEVECGGTGFYAFLEHTNQNMLRDYTPKGCFKIVLESRWKEFLDLILHHCIWSSENLPGGWNTLFLDDETAWNAVSSGMPVKAVNEFHYAHKLFNAQGFPIPQRMRFNYIDGSLDNATYDLKAVVEILQQRDDVTLHTGGGQRPRNNNSFIGYIPHYNCHSGRTRCISFDWHPSVEDYRTAWKAALKEPPPEDGAPWLVPTKYAFQDKILHGIIGLAPLDEENT